MKNIWVKGLGLMAFMGMLSVAEAQEPQKKVTIKVEKKGDGKVQIVERQLDVSNMTEKERDAAIECLQDSLIGDMNGNKRIKILIEDTDEPREDKFLGEESEGGENFESNENSHRRSKMIRKHKGGADSGDEFEWQMERFGDEMRRLGEELPKKFEFHMPQVYAWTDKMLAEIEPEAIRSFDVFLNKPENDVVNVRFFAAEAGDVTITIVDSKGKTVANKNVDDFEGEFVGQLEIKRAEKGTYFVIVSQGQYAQSRRVIIE